MFWTLRTETLAWTYARNMENILSMSKIHQYFARNFDDYANFE